jgi:Cu-processing system permease protein
MRRIATITSVVWLEMLRKKDVYVLLVLLAILLLSMLSVDVFGDTSATGFVKDLGLLFAWSFSWVLAILVTARQLPAEEKEGTIYSLLAKPITRLELILGKWLGAWTVVSAATLCFYAVIIGVVYLKGGCFERYDTVAQGYLLHVAALAILCAISLALSTRMNFDAAATSSLAFTVCASLIVPQIPSWLVTVEKWRWCVLIVLYWIMPHFEIFNMRQRLVFDGLPADWMVVGQIMFYGVVTTMAFLMLAWLGYAKKKFTRGATA